MEKVDLFAPGSLGTCWYGKYHYMEPWVGCGHSCPYCYARSRRSVHNSLEELHGEFARPTLQMPRQQLLEAIEKGVNSGEMHILKLCRFTDIFTPGYVADGLSYEIMEILAKSKLDRVIITTKGVPDGRTIELLAANPKMFSYNVAVHPAGMWADSPIKGLDAHLLDTVKRLEAAAEVKKGGALTTVHLDPFVAAIDDDPRALTPFLAELKRLGLNRVMWSYLLLSGGITASMSEALAPEVWQELQDRYDLLGARQILPTQDDTVSYATKEPIFLESVDKVYNALKEGGFEFVICSLKNVETLKNLKKYPLKTFCNGTFYA